MSPILDLILIILKFVFGGTLILSSLFDLIDTFKGE